MGFWGLAKANNYILKKEKLQDWIHEKCVDKVMGWDVYELSSRPGAEDLFTKIPTLDLCYIGKIKKKK